MRRQIHATIDGVLSNSVTGSSLASNGVRNFSFDLVTLTSFSTGSNTVIHLPGGGGSITLGTGRLQFDDTTGQLVGYNGPNRRPRVRRPLRRLVLTGHIPPRSTDASRPFVGSDP